MRRFLLFVLALILLISSCLAGCARDVESEDEYFNYSEGLEFVLSEDRTYMILAGIGACEDTTIVIPPTYNDLPVKEIKGSAFSPRSYESSPNIRKVIIPDSVIKIGGNAFSSCEYLSEVHIGKGVTEIGDDAFYNCCEPLSIYVKDMAAFCNIKLTNWLGGHIKNEYNLYLNGNLVEELIIPDTVTNIGNRIFGACISIKKVVLGKSVVSIGEYAFWNCKNLSEITFNNSLNCIEGYAFTSCNILMKANFENTSNWTVTNTYTQETQSLSSRELANASTAAKYLADDYDTYKWERK